jgi:hypothetical protein
MSLHGAKTQKDIIILNYVLPLMRETKFHTHTNKYEAVLIVSFILQILINLPSLCLHQCDVSN